MQHSRFLYSLIIVLLISLENVFSQSTNHWETAVFSEEQWRYRVNESELPSNWNGIGFDDSEWLIGNGGFGYGDDDDNTVTSACMSVSIRKKFTVSNKNDISAAILNVDYDDAFVAWINGVEVARSTGLSGQIILWDSPSTESHEAVIINGGTPQPFYINHDQLQSILVQGENVFAVEVHNIATTSSDLTLRPYLSFGISSTAQYYSPPPSWFVAPVENLNSNLPLIIIETNGQSISRDFDIVSLMKVIDNKDKRNSISDTEYTYNGYVHIKYHGQSSFYNDWPKKNYNVELIDVLENNIEVPLLGMPAGNDWVLYGPYNDKSLIRNALAYALGRRLGHYAPRTAFCEVVINGEYVGLYLLIEKIRRDNSRVDIAKLDATDTQGDDLTGGYIVKIDKGDWDEYAWTSPYSTNGNQVRFYWHYPKADRLLSIQKQYIQSYITTFENTLMGSSWNNLSKGYYKYVDMLSAADYFIINEFSKNIDAYRISTFLNKDKESKGGKLRFGPIWDYDLSFGNANYYEGESAGGWVFKSISPDDYYPVPFWWEKFMQDDRFKSGLKCRWESLRKTVLSETSVISLVDSCTNLIAEARIRNFQKYPIFGIWVWPNYFVGNTYEEEINYLKNFMLNRLNWMDAYIPGDCYFADEIDASGYYKASIKAYPNPFNDELTLLITLHKLGKVRVDFVDISGYTVWSKSEDVNVNYFELNLKSINIKSGLYLIRVLVNNEFVGTAKVVKM